MSLYNMMNGYNVSCILLMPMLGRKQDEYPRFRDCFLSEDGDKIVIYTRVGGNNRNQGYGEELLYQDENFVKTYDDDYDNTYGYYEFSVPEKWKSDFDKMLDSRFSEVSEEYINYLKEFYPLLSDEGVIDRIFKREN